MGKLFTMFCNYYQGMVGKSLRQYGLKYEDILVETDAVKKAVSWLSPEEREARHRRQVRALDLNMKRNYLPQDVQDMQDPFEPYLTKNLEEVEKLQKEREELTKW